MWKRLRFVVWRVIALLLFAAGGVALAIRFTGGLDAVSSLSDTHPWGLWFGLNVMCAGGLGFGGFAVAATHYVLRVECLRAAMRTAALAAFLGYLSVVLATMVELSRPWEIWRLPCTGCLAVSAGLVGLEFADGAVRMRRAAIWLMAAVGVLLSGIDQFSLSGLLLALTAKMHPLWYSPLLPLFLPASSIAAGMAAIVFLEQMGERAWGRPVHFRLWQTLSRAIGGAMAGLVVLRLADLYTRDSLASAFTFSFEAELFWMEMALFAAPVLSAFRPFRESPAAVYLSAVTVLGAFLFARLNLSLSALDAAADAPYFPTWAEAAIALSIIALAAALSGVALRQPLRKAPAVA